MLLLSGCSRYLLSIPMSIYKHIWTLIWTDHVKSSSKHLWAATTQLVMGKLLCSLSMEDSSLGRLPASILITSQTEIWKKSSPSSFSPCPVALTSCCSLISAQISPLHTWWDFQYASQVQIAEIELSPWTSSICFHCGKCDAYLWQSVCTQSAGLSHIVEFRSQYQVQNCISDIVFANHSAHNRKQLQGFLLSFPSCCSAICFLLSSYWAHACVTLTAVTRVNTGPGCHVYRNQGHTGKAVVYSNRKTGSGCKLETALMSLICCCQRDNVKSAHSSESSAAAACIHIVLCSDTALLQEIYTRQMASCANRRGWPLHRDNSLDKGNVITSYVEGSVWICWHCSCHFLYYPLGLCRGWKRAGISQRKTQTELWWTR